MHNVTVGGDYVTVNRRIQPGARGWLNIANLLGGRLGKPTDTRFHLLNSGNRDFDDLVNGIGEPPVPTWSQQPGFTLLDGLAHAQNHGLFLRTNGKAA